MADLFFEGFEDQPPGENVNVTTTTTFSNVLGGGTPLFSTAYSRTGAQCSEQTENGSYGFGTFDLDLTTAPLDLSAWYRIDLVDTGFAHIGGASGFELLALTMPTFDVPYAAAFHMDMSADAGDTVPWLVMFTYPTSDTADVIEHRIMAVPDGVEFGLRIVLSGGTATGYVYDGAGATLWTDTGGYYTGPGGIDGFYAALASMRIGRLGANMFDSFILTDDIRLAGPDGERHIRAYPRDRRAYPRPRSNRGYPAQP